MSKLVPNPDYQNAPYELKFWNKEHGVIADSNAWRFMEPYPESVKDSKMLFRWIQNHAVPSHILVEE